jgi:glycosyltransferase involved in cell wall biosynthesis
MRIAQISTLSTPVRGRDAGSIEGLVWLMAREMTAMGHEVTVFGAGGSEADAEIVSALPGPYAAEGVPLDWRVCEWINLCRAVEESGRFDILHDHAYLWGLALEPLSRAPIVHTLHISPNENESRLWARSPSAVVTALSKQQWAGYGRLTPAAVIPHGVDPAEFTLRLDPEDYVCYLGRFSWGKGPLLAVNAARALGFRLLLAGPENDYYREHIEPLVDGMLVEYVGPVAGRERDEFLGRARALLYPVQYPEPFGLVLVEAMMCGTPVAAIGIGAVPEIVENGVTGHLGSSNADFTEQIVRCFQLDRAGVRRATEARFSVSRMVRDYLSVYSEVAGRRG